MHPLLTLSAFDTVHTCRAHSQGTRTYSTETILLYGKTYKQIKSNSCHKYKSDEDNDDDNDDDYGAHDDGNNGDDVAVMTTMKTTTMMMLM